MTYLINLVDDAVTILGGAGFSSNDLDQCLQLAPKLISADGGVNRVKNKELIPDFIIGDLDSLKTKNKWNKLGVEIINISEQDTTDFEKCLYTVNSQLYLCLGFVGRRVDHFLSACSSIVKYHQKNIILVGSHDIIFHVPKLMEITLPVNTRLSLFPIKEVKGLSSKGLKWAINGIIFDPARRIGTANQTCSPKVNLELSDNGMLMILPKSCLKTIVELFLEVGDH
jgi:thiamine pyrophosphokinase